MAFTNSRATRGAALVSRLGREPWMIWHQARTPFAHARAGGTTSPVTEPGGRGLWELRYVGETAAQARVGVGAKGRAG